MNPGPVGASRRAAFYVSNGGSAGASPCQRAFSLKTLPGALRICASGARLASQAVILRAGTSPLKNFLAQRILRPRFRRAVAQLGSALEWGSRGRGFESRRPDHL